MAIVPLSGIPGKVCNRCEQWKPVANFGAFKLARDGYENCCKAVASRANALFNIVSAMELRGRFVQFVQSGSPLINLIERGHLRMA